MAIVDPNKVAELQKQLDSGSKIVTMGNRSFNADSPVVKRALTKPETVTFMGYDKNLPETSIPTKDPISTPSPTPSTGTTGLSLNTLTPEQTRSLTTPTLDPTEAQKSLGLAQQQYLGMPGQSAFDLQMKEILANRAAVANQGLYKAGQETAGGLLALPEELAATEGFAGLNLDQARRMASIEEAGLTNLFNGISSTLEGRRSRLKELGELAGQAYMEESQRASDLVSMKETELQRALEYEQSAFNKELAILQMQMSIPAGSTFELDGKTYEGKGAVVSGGGRGGGGGGMGDLEISPYAWDLINIGVRPTNMTKEEKALYFEGLTDTQTGKIINELSNYWQYEDQRFAKEFVADPIGSTSDMLGEYGIELSEKDSLLESSEANFMKRVQGLFE